MKMVPQGHRHADGSSVLVSQMQRLMGRQDALAVIGSEPAALTWIPGPAGTGKTCLALEYIAASGRPAVWFQFDRADADPSEFFHHFGAAIAAMGVAPGWTMPALLPEHLPALHGYVRIFTRSLATKLLPSICFIFDNVHECDDQCFFPRLLDNIVQDFPPDAKVLLLSRRGPPAACARLQVHGELRIVDTQSLMLASRETERLLRHLGVPNAGAAAEAVYHATGGWAAGIVMAAAILKHHGECELDARIPQEPMAQDYFAQEVYSLLGEAERDALLTVCWLSRIPIGSCDDALLGPPLRRLLAGGALMRRFDSGSYALNPLLQGFLRAWAGRTLKPEELQHRIDGCIELLLALRLQEDAVELSLAHQRTARTVHLISQLAPALIEQSCHQTVARWIQAVPASARTGMLNYWLGMALKLSDPRQARGALTAALAQFEASGDRACRYIALGTIVGTYFMDSAGCEPLWQLVARHAIDHQADYDNVVDARQRAHLIFSVGTGILSAEPGHPHWAMWEQRALEAIRSPGDAEARMRVVSMLSHHYFLSGRHKQLQALVESIGTLARLSELTPYARALVGLLSLYVALVTSSEDLDETYRKSRRWSDETGVTLIDGHCASLYASALIVRGRIAEALRILDDLASQTPAGNKLQHAHVAISRAWAANWVGDHKAAHDHANDGIAAADAIGNVPFAMLARSAQATALAVIDPDECRARIVDLQRAACQYYYPHLMAYTDLLLAWLELQAAGGRQDVLEMHLSRGLRQLEDVGTGMLLNAIPQMLSPLCDFALEHGIERSSAMWVIRRFRLSPPHWASRHWPWPIRIRCLGSFELEIDGLPYESGRKSKHRQLDLLKILAAHAPQAKSSLAIANWLWPEADANAAMRNFTTTLSRLRGLVGNDAIAMDQGTLRLNPAMVFVDVAELRGKLNELDEALAFSTANGAALECAVWRILKLYTDHLLPGESSSPISRLRDTLRSRVTSALARVVACLPSTTEPARIIHLLERLLEIDPCAEAIALALMTTLVAQGQHASALKAYRRYQVAAQTVGAKPPKEMLQLANALFADAQ
jgi:LuxR family maltose regulon positive regulatory protein